MKLKEVNTIQFSPDAGSVTLPVDIEDDDKRFEKVNLTGNYDTSVINSLTLDLGTNWSYCNIVVSYLSNSIPDPMPDNYDPTKEGDIVMHLDFRKEIYDDETDPEHQHPIDVITKSQNLTVSYVQGVNAPAVEQAEYDSSSEPTDDSEITRTQEELSGGEVLGNNKADIKKQLIIKQCDLDKEAKKVRNSYLDDVDRITKLENKLKKFNQELDEERSKKKPNATKINNLTDKINDNNEKLYKLMESMDNTSHLPSTDYDYLQWINSTMGANNEIYIDNKYEELKDSNKGMEIDDQMNKLESNFKYLQKFAPEMVSNIATAPMEPNTAIVTTPTGPGAVAGNPMQSTGTLKRIMGQVLALSPVLLDLLNQCRVLNLPQSVSGPIISLSKVIGMLQKLLK